jgi:AraC-like DNA-binding protein
MNPKAQFAISFLRMNLHRVVVIGELAELVKLSRSRLCYLFKAELGLSPSQYLKVLRMERSRELLEATFLSIKEVAGKVGYNDSSRFMRDFKKFYGMTPSLFRTSRPHKDISHQSDTTG